MRELQRVFAMLMRSNRKYIDPSPVIAALRDHHDNPVVIGPQQDVGGMERVFGDGRCSGQQSVR